MISENATDRPWNEREYIRVNWAAQIHGQGARPALGHLRQPDRRRQLQRLDPGQRAQHLARGLAGLRVHRGQGGRAGAHATSTSPVATTPSPTASRSPATARYPYCAAERRASTAPRRRSRCARPSPRWTVTRRSTTSRWSSATRRCPSSATSAPSASPTIAASASPRPSACSWPTASTSGRTPTIAARTARVPSRSTRTARSPTPVLPFEERTPKPIVYYVSPQHRMGPQAVYDQYYSEGKILEAQLGLRLPPRGGGRPGQGATCAASRSSSRSRRCSSSATTRSARAIPRPAASRGLRAAPRRPALQLPLHHHRADPERAAGLRPVQRGSGDR